MAFTVIGATTEAAAEGALLMLAATSPHHLGLLKIGTAAAAALP